MISKLTVSQVVAAVKDLLEGNFRDITVEGEISNLSCSSSGHWYFTLSDADSGLSAALFKMDAMRNPIIRNLKDGDKVLCLGSLGVYGKRGTFQLITKKIVPAGQGDLKEQFERLKKKLASEGLFDLDKKRAIPAIPKRIGLITAEGSAALADFLNICQRRAKNIDILISPALVQGDAAAASIIRAFKKLLENNTVDVIVLARGGGSMEDLWSFNDEALARVIAASPIPTVSAIGHQVDFTISDYVADLRAETPSAAAELLTQAQMEHESKMINLKQRLQQVAKNILSRPREILSQAHPQEILGKIWENFQNAKNRLNRVDLKHRAFEMLGLHDKMMELDDLISRTDISIKETYKQVEHKLEKNHSLLLALGPSQVLKRGYTYTTLKSGEVIESQSNFKKIKSGESLTLHWADGMGVVTKE